MTPDDSMALGLPSTYEDLRDLPDDGRRYELLDGALVVTPAPGGRHQIVVGALYRLLWAARPSGATVLVSPIDFVPRPDSVLQPVRAAPSGCHPWVWRIVAPEP